LTEAGDYESRNDCSAFPPYDPANMELRHCVEQALKARLPLTKKDRYQNVQTVGADIVDDFTGRLMQGRRVTTSSPSKPKKVRENSAAQPNRRQ